MRTKLVFFSVCLFFNLPIFAQAPDIDWEISLGGSLSDYGTAIKTTSDGGAIVVGFTLSYDGDITDTLGTQDAWMIKLDSTGSMTWQKSFGGSGYDYFYSVQQTHDSGYIALGFSGSNDGDCTDHHGAGSSYDFFLIKTDDQGSLEWEKSLGGLSYDFGNTIRLTKDGGYLIIGASQSINGDLTVNHGQTDFWLVKLNTSGNIEWQKTFGGSDYDSGEDALETSDGGYIMVGSSWSADGNVDQNFGEADVWVVKLDSLHNIVWKKSMGGSDIDYAYSVQQDAHGDFIIAGKTISVDRDITNNYGMDDAWLIKLDIDGTLLWQKCYGSYGPDDAKCVQLTTDGGYIFAGASGADGDDVSTHFGYEDYWLVKTDKDGVIQWEKSLGDNRYDYAYEVEQTSDEGFILVGTSKSFQGEVSGNHGSDDIWVVKLNKAITEIKENKEYEPMLSLYPNPVYNGFLSILNHTNEAQEYRILDLQGRLLQQGVLKTKENRLDIRYLSAGTYIIKTMGTSRIFNIVVR